MLIMVTTTSSIALRSQLTPNETDEGNDFVETQLGAATGNVSADTTGNDNGDMDLLGVELTLLDSNGDTVATTTTNASGDYGFLNVMPGEYTEVESQPTDYVDVSEVEGGTDGDNPDDGVINSIAVTVDPNETAEGNDFVETQLGAVTGNVSADTTGDDLGDMDLLGVEITLLDSNGDTVATTTTNADGDYIFSDVMPGEYTEVESQPTDYVDVSEVEGGTDGDNPDDGVINSIAVTVDPNETDDRQ